MCWACEKPDPWVCPCGKTYQFRYDRCVECKTPHPDKFLEPYSKAEIGLEKQFPRLPKGVDGRKK